MNLPSDLNDEIWNYCRLNAITNIDDFTLKLVKQGFTIEKYGAAPTPRVVEKIVEVVKEVPVEKIVEKIVTNDEEVKQLHEQLTKLKEENKDLLDKIKELKNKKDLYGEN